MPISRTTKVAAYFSAWISLALLSVMLNALNVDWNETPIPQGIVLVLLLAVLQGSVLEIPVQTVATLIMGGYKRHNR